MNKQICGEGGWTTHSMRSPRQQLKSFNLLAKNWKTTSIQIKNRWTRHANDLHNLALWRPHGDGSGPNKANLVALILALQLWNLHHAHNNSVGRLTHQNRLDMFVIMAAWKKKTPMLENTQTGTHIESRTDQKRNLQTHETHFARIV